MELIKVLCDMMKHIFQLFRHVMQCLVHLVDNETAAIEIIPNVHQKNGDALSF